MWFIMFALLGFSLAIVFFIIIRMAVAHHYKNMGKAESQLIYFIDTHTILEVTGGPLTKLLTKLHRQHKTPQIRLFVFKQEEYLIALRDKLPENIKKMLPEPPLGPFSYALRWGSAKFSIFFPEQWLNNGLGEEAVCLVICHEAGHIFYRRREALLGLFYYIRGLFSRRHSRDYFDEKFYDKKDSWANAFSAKIMGKEKSIQLLEEIRDNLKRNRQL